MNLNGEEQEYDNKLTVAGEHADTDLAFVFETPGTHYIDNVRIEEDSLIKDNAADLQLIIQEMRHGRSS